MAQVFDLLDGEFTLFAIHTQLRISKFIEQHSQMINVIIEIMA